MRLPTILAVTVALALGAASCSSEAEEKRVTGVDELREALQKAEPGSSVLLAPGEYAGGLSLENLKGEEGRPIVIGAADPQNPPRIVGGAQAIHLSNVSYVELRDLCVSGQSGNGLNIDDGGSFDTPAHDITLTRLTVTDIGPRGNRDGIKLSGVEDFVVRDCRIERWGDGGSGIDMVGCHGGLIKGCRFTAREGLGGSGVQAKGGSSRVTVRRCLFEHAGGRAVNIGGSTGLQFFRPQGVGYEARDITVEGNVFVGSQAPFAFVGVDGAKVEYNTVYLPQRWAMRILQETTEPGFVPCRDGVFRRNIVVFQSDKWSEGGVNIGPNTAPASFVFEKNLWYCRDRPDRSKPALPTEEIDGLYGQDPLLADPPRGDFTLKEGSPAEGLGHTGLEEE